MKFTDKIKALAFTSWPVIGLVILNILIIITNYKSGTSLTGWDNLHPEFNFGLNIQRSFFSVWQEYQSLGLLGGMGHAADFFRQLFLYFMSFFLPNEVLRYFWTFLTLFIGSLGAFFLTRIIFFNQKRLNSQVLAFLAALFYILNLATIQNFYVPYETFTTHFASLPWIILSTVLFLKRGDLKTFLFLLIVFVLSTSSFYVPTILVALIISILIYSITTLIYSTNKRLIMKRVGFMLAAIFIINSFWLLPFLYFTLTNVGVNLDSKINQMATTTVFLQNKDFGNLFNVALLKGFWFSNIDPNLNGDFAYMLAPWREHLSNPFVLGAGFTLFLTILTGALASLKSKSRSKKAFLILLLFSFTMLATATPPFSWINEIFRKIPLFDQAFRFPFTKFSTLASLMFSIFFAFGIEYISNLILKTKIKQTARNFIMPIISIVLILFFTFPVFQGHLFYEKEKISIPSEYSQVFDFFKNQDIDGRIVNLPQPSFWGWEFYRWGYGGSGFLWYGIKQPILDRAFDVWSGTSENYYYELSQALYSNDQKMVYRVLNKYQAKWVILDKNIIYPQAPKALIYDKTEILLALTPGVKKEKEFGNIKIYSVALLPNPNLFISSLGKLPKIGHSSWTSNDNAFENFGNYISASQNDHMSLFGSLFSQKTSSEKDFTLLNRPQSIELKKNVKLLSDSNLKIPPYFAFETIAPVVIETMLDNNGDTIISLTPTTPTISIDNNRVWGNNIIIPLFIVPKGENYPIDININGVSSFTIKAPAGKDKAIIGTGFLSANQDNAVVLSGKQEAKTQIIRAQIIKDLFNKDTVSVSMTTGSHEIEIDLPKINDAYLSFNADIKKAQTQECNTYRKGEIKQEVTNERLNLYSKNTTTCISFVAPQLLPSEGLAVFIESTNINGRGLHFWALNESQNFAPIDTYLAKNNDFHSFVIPKMQQDGKGYSFHLDNISIGKEVEENTIKNIAAYPLPYSYLTNFYIDSKEAALSLPEIETNGLKIKTVSHPQESLYELYLEPGSSYTTLTLGQSYNSGWQAYSVSDKNNRFLNQYLPFIFGKKISNHVTVNSWANGWILEEGMPENRHIIIVFLPQYLEYFGFLTLFIFMATLSSISLKQRGK